jgi:uncharacterized protein YjbI with pentapeptide repeats
METSMTKSTIAGCLIWLSSYVALLGDTYNPAIKRGPFVGNLKFEPKMIATGHRLWGCEVVGQDLRGASFDNCDLSGVAFRQCELDGATFRNAVLTGMIIDDCTWGNNDFTNAVINGIVRQSDTDKTGVTRESLLTTWSFQNRDLSNCYIPPEFERGYDFSQFDLSGAYLDGVKKAVFVKCRLYRTFFERCDLSTCDFTEALIQESSFRSCKIDYKQLQMSCMSLMGNSLIGAEFVELDLSESVFGANSLIAQNSEAVNLTNTTLFGVTTNVLNSKNIVTTKSYKTGRMVNMTLIRCDLTGVDFSRQVLVNTEFSECKLDGCKFENAVITNTTFHACTGLTREQIFSTWNVKSGRSDGIILPEN